MNLVVLVERVSGIERIDLEGGETLFQGGTDFVAFALQPKIAAGVEADAIADRAAEQLIDRLPANFAGNVPKRLVDSAGGAACHNAATEVKAALELLPDEIDAARVLADQERREVLVDHGHDCVLVPLGGGFADSDDAFVRLDPHEDPVARWPEIV